MEKYTIFEKVIKDTLMSNTKEYKIKKQNRIDKIYNIMETKRLNSMELIRLQKELKDLLK